MHAEPSMVDDSKLDLPPDLIHALNNRKQKPKTDFRIEALKPSLFGRIVEKLVGPRK